MVTGSRVPRAKKKPPPSGERAKFEGWKGGEPVAYGIRQQGGHDDAINAGSYG